MIDNQKYKVNTLAKDLSIKSKDLIELCEKLGLAGKKTSSVIENDEYSLILNRITFSNQLNNFDDYLNGAARIFKEVIKQEEKSSEPPVEEKAAPETDSAEKKTKKAPAVENTKQEEAPAADSETKEETKPVRNVITPAMPKFEDKKIGNTREKATNRFENKPDFSQQQKGAKKPAKPEKKNQQQAVPQKPVRVTSDPKNTVYTDTSRIGKTRIVDTHAGSVDLSKYDEKLDRYDTENSRGGMDSRQKQGKKSAPQTRQTSKGPQNGKNQPQKNRLSPKDLAAERKKQAELEKARKLQLTVSIPDEITVGELASRLKATASEVVKKLMLLGIMASVNQTVDFDTAYLVADELGAKVVREVSVSIEEKLFEEEADSEENLVTRAPVVVVMGHVDHGKTSILDSIRKTNVTAGEAGGITQAIGAYRVIYDGKPITFLDTPGHEAFTAMRARGAMATDIAILVVAADDGIMPQTVEAINHAKAANLDIVVAINKMDKPGANPEGIKQELTKYDLIPEEWGGDVICVPCSALTGMGIDKLLENLLIVAEVKELKANPAKRAKGIVIEAKLDKGRGPVATVLVQNGTLHSGDTVIAGTAVGRVRAMRDDAGRTVSEAGPSVPVEITGLSDVPTSGDEFNAVADERMARELADKRREKQRNDALSAGSKVSLDDLFAQINEGAKELRIVVKADVVGSAEAVKQSLEKLSTPEVKVKVIHSAVGGIIEGDVMLASASNAIIVGFNVRPDRQALDAAERQKVDIRTYRIIYECIDEIEAAMKGMLAPVYKEQLLGHADVRQTIHVPNVGTIAGCYVTDGKISRKGLVRVLRDSVVIFDDKISSLRRFKDDVREVASGYECGVGLEKFNDIKEGDVLEIYEMVEQGV
ncbi:MAG: translation initiation factor IF-2 [Clostridia bacterium]|nr:translation initiation factor IF-2 [Clostridia bacterium]